MIDYIVADIKRIMKKNSFLYVVIGYLLLFFLIYFIKSGPTYQSQDIISDIESLNGWFPLFCGLVLFLAVYYDDFKAKTMQIAIGFGISRNKVVLSKIISIFILVGLMMAVICLFLIGIPQVFGSHFTNSQIKQIILSGVTEWIRTVGMVCLSIPLIYYTQNVINGVLIYILLASRFVLLIGSSILEREFIRKIFGDLSQYLLTFNVYSLKTQIIRSEEISLVKSFILILYILIPILLSIAAFRNKELEF
ncbi:hypothetical protein [Facklamia miroungae]|uniref:ABC-2 family transporter protein n=1 Tax=Facklamia miroungae TaxID=120956 RepID=A0A1G7Q8M7_9LACT|nr:hypothetical protein [Facklamia miroungae]NKZ28858.1 hypothetical protein [Facklamia miroungae]SDF94815.1 hypothetical protein SAMN05421791_1026 [Facklamia miroungae]